MPKVTRRGLHFRSTVNSDSDETDEYEVAQDSTIEHAEVRFYPGQQLDLEIEIEVITPEGNSKYVIDPAGEKPYLSGDDDFFKFNISVPVETGDKIRITARNQDTNGNDYDYIVNLELDRIGGIERVMDSLSGVFQ